MSYLQFTPNGTRVWASFIQLATLDVPGLRVLLQIANRDDALALPITDAASAQVQLILGRLIPLVGTPITYLNPYAVSHYTQSADLSSVSVRFLSGRVVHLTAAAAAPLLSWVAPATSAIQPGTAAEQVATWSAISAEWQPSGYRLRTNSTTAPTSLVSTQTAHVGSIGANNVRFGLGLISATGFQSTAVGQEALRNMADGNVAVGYRAMYSGTGFYNVAVGNLALQNSPGFGNVAVGDNAYGGTLGDSNTAVGASAMRLWSGGYGNVVIGTDTAYNVGSGSQNTIIGQQAHQGVTGNIERRIIIGASAARPGGHNDTLVIGTGQGFNYTQNVTPTTAANQVAIGTPFSQLLNYFLGAGAQHANNNDGPGISLQPTPARGTNRFGGNIDIRGGQSTGNAVGGAIQFQTTTPGASGSAAAPYATRLSIIGQDVQFLAATRLGFYGATPIARPAVANPGSFVDLAAAYTAWNNLRTALVNLGLIS